MNKFVYTFKTFPGIKTLQNIFPNLFVFNKLKADLKSFEEGYLNDEVEYVIGVAKARGPSRIETKVINKFNKNSIDKSGDDEFNLFAPENEYFAATKNPYRTMGVTFCNYVTYNIAKMSTRFHYKVIFIHLNLKDINKFIDFIKSL